jgi:hypothetical protein
VLGLAILISGCSHGVVQHEQGGLRLLTVDGTQPGDEASVRGTVAVTAGGCVGIQDAGGSVHAVIWPAGSYLSGNDSVVAHGLGEFAIGSEVSGTGGYYKHNEALSEMASACRASDDEVIRIR